jgi:hypothetical protein
VEDKYKADLERIAPFIQEKEAKTADYTGKAELMKRSAEQDGPSTSLASIVA